MKMTKGDAHDPKGLIAESYRIEGISIAECRSIFLDWALGYQGDMRAGLENLLQRYEATSHPMTEVIREGLQTTAKPRRRGGWRSRDRG